jgi:hypothetical protein
MSFPQPVGPGEGSPQATAKARTNELRQTTRLAGDRGKNEQLVISKTSQSHSRMIVFLGLTRATDHRIAKMILGYPFNL